MTIDEKINGSSAMCIANSHGRILTANKRFCRMFGFEQNEVEWHYICDLYRNYSEWQVLSKSIPAPKEEQTFSTKMRNRSGRSFSCLIKRRAAKSVEGIPLLVHSIRRIAA